MTCKCAVADSKRRYVSCYATHHYSDRLPPSGFLRRTPLLAEHTFAQSADLWSSPTLGSVCVVPIIHIIDEDTMVDRAIAKSLCGVTASGNAVPEERADESNCNRCKAVLRIERTVAPREYKRWTVCDATGASADNDHICPVHQHGQCLIEVQWVGRGPDGLFKRFKRLVRQRTRAVR